MDCDGIVLACSCRAAGLMRAVFVNTELESFISGVRGFCVVFACSPLTAGTTREVFNDAESELLIIGGATFVLSA